jgi:putative ABC transport system permease protein
MGEVSFSDHTDHPFRVVGILAPTGTPVDRTVHVSLAGIDAMHANFFGGMSVRGLRIHRSEPANITAFIVGLHSRSAIFAVQREVNEFKGEPLLAILPGLTLQQLWDIIALGENALRVVALLVLLVSLVTMTTALLTSLQERRREMAILRALGARPRHVFLLVLGESMLLATIAALLGLATLQLATVWAAGLLEAQYGLALSAWPIAAGEWRLLGLLFVGALVAGAVPAFTAYRRSVADGMSIRL